MILSFSIVFYMMTGLVIPFAISIHYFKQGAPRYLVGYFAAPFCGFWLSFFFATPFIIYEKLSKNIDLFQGRDTLTANVIFCSLVFTVFTLNIAYYCEARSIAYELIHRRIQ